MAVTSWLIDKSTLVRLHESPSASEWSTRIQRGLVHVTTMTRLEVGFSARSGAEHAADQAGPPISAMPVQYLTPAIEDRAVAVQGMLAGLGRHRAPSLPDFLIAATAEITGLSVLHVDQDFELIAEVTGQPHERLALED